MPSTEGKDILVLGQMCTRTCRHALAQGAAGLGHLPYVGVNVMVKPTLF